MTTDVCVDTATVLQLHVASGLVCTLCTIQVITWSCCLISRPSFVIVYYQELSAVPEPVMASNCSSVLSLSQVIANSRALGARLMKYGYKLVTDGTDNHLVLWDMRKEVMRVCETAALLCEICPQNRTDALAALSLPFAVCCCSCCCCQAVRYCRASTNPSHPNALRHTELQISCNNVHGGF